MSPKDEALSNPKIFLIIFSPSLINCIQTIAKIPAAKVFEAVAVFFTVEATFAAIFNPGIKLTTSNIISNASGLIKVNATSTNAKYIIQ